MKFIDTHAHLYDEAFLGEEDAAVARACEAGVTKIIFPDIDSETRDLMFDIAGRHEGTVFPCLGLHPTSVGAGWQKDLSLLEGYLDRKIWAIGEIGMDCYWSKEFVKEQQEVLRIQLELADRLSLPVIIHSRESTELILNVLRDCRHLSLRGVFHAYTDIIFMVATEQEGINCRNGKKHSSRKDTARDRLTLPHTCSVPRKEE